MSILYHGLREHGGGPNAVHRIDTDAAPESSAVPLDWRLSVRNHSPTGLEWGYGGSGPAQLALALCVDALDGDVRHAQRVYQNVKWQLVAPLDREEWTLTKAEILAAIDELHANGIGLPEPETFCKHCGTPITSAELCATCAKDNDPFITTKYRGDYTP